MRVAPLHVKEKKTLLLLFIYLCFKEKATGAGVVNLTDSCRNIFYSFKEVVKKTTQVKVGKFEKVGKESRATACITT